MTVARAVIHSPRITAPASDLVVSNSNFAVWYNYGQIANTIDDQLGFGCIGWERRSMVDGVKDSTWLDVGIPFTPNDETWLCYGSNPAVQVFRVAGVARLSMRALRAAGRRRCRITLLTWGFHAVWQNTPEESVAPTRKIKGEMHIRRVQLFEDQ